MLSHSRQSCTGLFDNHCRCACDGHMDFKAKHGGYLRLMQNGRVRAGYLSSLQSARTHLTYLSPLSSQAPAPQPAYRWADLGPAASPPGAPTTPSSIAVTLPPGVSIPPGVSFALPPGVRRSLFCPVQYSLSHARDDEGWLLLPRGPPYSLLKCVGSLPVQRALEQL